jgi:hypothetical protein
LAGNERGEEGKVGRRAETGLERKSEIAGGLTGVGEPVIEGIEEKSGEIKEVGVGRGPFKIRNERIDEGEGFLLGGLLGGGIGIEEEEFGTTGEGPDGAKAGLDAELPGGVVDGDEVGLFALTRREQGRGLVGRGAIAGQQRTESEVGEVERGVVHAFPARLWSAGRWVCRMGGTCSR